MTPEVAKISAECKDAVEKDLVPKPQDLDEKIFTIKTMVEEVSRFLIDCIC